MLTEDTVCYRHPQAKAAVGCQRCERPICTECMNQASIGHHCPTCLGENKQQVYTPRNMPSGGVTAVQILIAINVVVFFAQQASPTLVTTGWLRGFEVSEGEWWRIFTSGFLHGSIFHIGFNMYMLYMLGNPLLEGYGKIRFLLMYLAGLLGGSFAVVAFDFNQSTIGASGAVLGLGGALAAVLWARGINITQTSIGFLLLANLALPLVIGGISFWGHFGGIVAGFGAGWLISWLPQRYGQSQKIAVGSVVALCVALLGATAFAASSGGFI